MKKNLLKCLWVSKVVDIGLLRPATIPQVVVDVVKVVDRGILRPASLPQVIEEVMDLGQVLPSILPFVVADDMLIYGDLGQKIPATIPLAIG